MSYMFMILLFTSILIVIFFVVYMFLYARHVNKALNENNGKHYSLPDVRSILSAIIIAILLINVFSLNSQVEDLSDSIEELSDRLNKQIAIMSYDLDRANDSLNEIKESTKYISSYDFSVRDTNPKDMMIDLYFQINLKKFTEDTSVSISVNNNVAELTKSSSGIYIGTLTINMFEKIESVSALVTDDGTTISEPLNDIYVEDIWKEILPSMDVKSTEEFTYDDGEINIYDEIFIYMNNTDNCFTDAYVEILIEKESAKKIDIGFSKDKQDYEITFNESLKLDSPDKLVDIYVVATDNLGYTHRVLTNSWKDSAYYLSRACEEIYDDTGKRINNVD